MTDLIIPQIAFERVVKEILAERSDVMQITRSAVALLHEQTENMLHEMFVNTKLVSDMQGTSVIRLPHMKLVYALTKIKGPPSHDVTIPTKNNNDTDNDNDNNNGNGNDNEKEKEYEHEYEYEYEYGDDYTEVEAEGNDNEKAYKDDDDTEEDDDVTEEEEVVSLRVAL
jgi:histone H3/H4